MPEKSINQELRLQKMKEIISYLLRETNQNKLMSKKHRKVCRFLNYMEHLLILFSTVTWYVFIFAFPSLVRIPIGITTSATKLKICGITSGIKKYKSIIKKNKKKHDKILLLAKSKLNRIDVLNSKTLNDSNISHDEFISINNKLREFYDMKEEIKNSNNKQKFKLYIKQCYLIVWSLAKVQKVKNLKLQKQKSEE